MRKIKLVIFDLDGTLVDAYRAIEESVRYTAHRFGIPQPASAVIRRAVGWGDRNLLASFISTLLLDKVLKVYRRHHAGTLRRLTKAYSGVPALLAGLRRSGYLLAIASNRPARFTAIILRGSGLKKYFHTVLCADQIHFRKPHPQILNTIMRKLKVTPGQTLYVGDMYIDAQAARRAGVRAVTVTTGSSTRKELVREKPYRIIDDIRSLVRVLSARP